MALSAAFKILIGTGVVANLGTGLENSAITLKLGGILQDNGVYGSSDSPAIPPNNTYFSGTGVLNVSDVVGATKLVITGNSTQIAGGSQTITITAKDNFGNVDGSYDGDRVLTFSGASSSPAPSTIRYGSPRRTPRGPLFGHRRSPATRRGARVGRPQPALIAPLEPGMPPHASRLRPFPASPSKWEPVGERTCIASRASARIP